MSRCPTCGRQHKRSNDANRRYWALINAIAGNVKPDGNLYSSETWHQYFKQKLLGAEELKLPNGKTHLVIKSSADLDKSEFNDYMTKIEAWAAERDVYLDEFA